MFPLMMQPSIVTLPSCGILLKKNLIAQALYSVGVRMINSSFMSTFVMMISYGNYLSKNII